MTNYKDSDKRLEEIIHRAELMIEASYMVGWVTRDVEGEKSQSKKIVFPKENAKRIREQVKSFLHQELDRARKEERKTILNHITKIVLKYHNDYIAMCEIIKYFTKLKTK
jgi:hypothetical protein